MVTDTTLDRQTYAVYVRVPETWWTEADVVLEVAMVLRVTKASVRLRLAHLISLKLVERRKRQTIEPVTEIRRVGK